MRCDTKHFAFSSHLFNVLREVSNTEMQLKNSFCIGDGKPGTCSDLHITDSCAILGYAQKCCRTPYCRTPYVPYAVLSYAVLLDMPDMLPYCRTAVQRISERSYAIHATPRVLCDPTRSRAIPRDPARPLVKSFTISFGNWDHLADRL